MANPQLHPNAFTVRPAAGGWESLDENGRVVNFFTSEASAKFDATIRRSKYLQRAGAAPSVTPGFPPVPPPPPSRPTPPPVGTASGLAAAMAAAAASATPPAPPQPSAGPQPAPPPPNPPGSPWPANMGGAGPPPPTPPSNPTPYAYWSPGAVMFPKNMQPPPPAPPRPKPGYGQQFAQAFGQSYAKQAQYGYATVGRAAQAAFTAVAPEAAIPLAVAQEAKRALVDSVKSLHTFAESMTAANRELAPFSAKLQMSYAQLALNDLRRTQNMARQLENPAASLAKFTDEMRQALMPFTVASRQAQMEGGAFGAGAIGGLGKELKPLADLFTGLKNLTDPEGGLAHSLGETIVSGLVGAMNPLIGPILAGVQSLNESLGFDSKGEAVGPGGPWEGMILQQAGAMRAEPIIPNRKVNLGRR